MNVYLSKKSLQKYSVIQKNYGISHSLFAVLASKHGVSTRFCPRHSVRTIHRYLDQNPLFFNRFLKLNRKKKMESIKKQSSWRSLRLRQGLPVNGQRTHTNSSVSKKLNASLYAYNI